MSSVDPWLRKQVLTRSCGVGPKGTFAASFRWSALYLRRDIRLSGLVMLSLLAIIPAFFVVIGYPSSPKVLFETMGLALFLSVVWIFRWFNWTTGAEIDSLRSVFEGTTQEKGYAQCVVRLAEIESMHLRQSCLEHLAHALELARAHPEERVWPLIDEELRKLAEGAIDFGAFEQKMGQVRSMFRAVREA